LTTWTNSVAESWFATYKTELVYRGVWTTIAKLRTATFDYIEVFYNRKRRHSALGGLSPVCYEQSRQGSVADAA
jgi:putative transposase